MASLRYRGVRNNFAIMPFLGTIFSGSKMDPFAFFWCRLLFWRYLYECRFFCAAMTTTQISHFPHYTETTGTTYHVLVGILLVCSSSSQCCCCWSLQRVPRLHCTKKDMAPLESKHGHHLQWRAAFARAARGRPSDPKRAATAPGCRACSSSRDNCVGSLVGQDQTQANSNSCYCTRSPEVVRGFNWGLGECGCERNRFGTSMEQPNSCDVDELWFSCVLYARNFCCYGTWCTTL